MEESEHDALPGIIAAKQPFAETFGNDRSFDAPPLFEKAHCITKKCSKKRTLCTADTVLEDRAGANCRERSVPSAPRVRKKNDVDAACPPQVLAAKADRKNVPCDTPGELHQWQYLFFADCIGQ